MSYPVLSQAAVLDLVPFGNIGSETRFFALRLTPPRWESWQPGQFIMLRPTLGGHERVWARPFSLCQVTKRDLVIFFQVRGRATSRMANLVPGETVDIWGPLGNGLAMETKTPTLLLAGGIGISPFVGYAHAHPTPGYLALEFGHRMSLDCYPYESLNERITCNAYHEKTDSDRIRFLQNIENRIAEYAPKGLILACGPTPFLVTVQQLSAKYKAKTQLCLETRMGCGIGACLGCVVKANVESGTMPSETTPPIDSVARTNVTTCTCGPNFWADAITF